MQGTPFQTVKAVHAQGLREIGAGHLDGQVCGSHTPTANWTVTPPAPSLPGTCTWVGDSRDQATLPACSPAKCLSCWCSCSLCARCPPACPPDTHNSSALVPQVWKVFPRRALHSGAFTAVLQVPPLCPPRSPDPVTVPPCHPPPMSSLQCRDRLWGKATCASQAGHLSDCPPGLGSG